VCKAKGNVLDFVAAMEKCSVRDAALKLTDWFSLTTAEAAGRERQHTAPPQNAGGTGSQLAREKAGDRREPNHPLTFTLKGIDYAHPYLAERGIEKETAEYFGVGFFPGKGSMSGRIVIPIENDKGELVAYAGRSIDGSEPKYKLPAEFRKSQVLFNLPRALEEDSTGTVILVEGFFDCMKVVQAGHVCVAALLEIVDGFRMTVKLLLVEDGRGFQHDRDIRGRRGNLLLQVGDGLVEGKTLRQLHKADQIAATATAVTIEQILARIDIERRLCFPMQGAQPHKFC